jgi:hypothetical protein
MNVTFVDPTVSEERGTFIDERQCSHFMKSDQTAVVAIVEDQNSAIAFSLDECLLSACDAFTNMGRDRTRHVRYVALDRARLPLRNGHDNVPFGYHLADELNRALKYLKL